MSDVQRASTGSERTDPKRAVYLAAYLDAYSQGCSEDQARILGRCAVLAYERETKEEGSMGMKLLEAYKEVGAVDE